MVVPVAAAAAVATVAAVGLGTCWVARTSLQVEESMVAVVAAALTLSKSGKWPDKKPDNKPDKQRGATPSVCVILRPWSNPR
ncbi:MAG: hypothetical protein FWD57_02055 [Polyangiaceae bacterium]|nr:hypothetical protein [Polyangiaceae bacterium]